MFDLIFILFHNENEPPSEAAHSDKKTADASHASGKSNFKICMTLPHPCGRLGGDVPDAKVKSRPEPST